MNRRVALLVTVGLASAAAIAPQPQRERGVGVPCVSWSGPDSRIVSPRFARIGEEKAWLALWGEHVGKDEVGAHPVWQTAPRIDFSRFEVVAYFRGKATNSNGERVAAIDDTAEGLRIRFESAWYQTSSFDGPDHGVACTPYGIWVIDRTPQALIVEENVQGLIGQPPKWKEQARLAPGG